MPRNRRVRAAIVSLATVVSIGAPQLRAEDPPADSSADVVALRGRVTCLDALAATPADPAADPCNQPGARFELRTSPSESVRFLAEDAKAQIFTDPRVRERELEVRGWRRAGGTFEVLSVYSIVGGVPHHLHYRCDVCDIDAYAPGPCWCCGQPFELREDAVGAGPADKANPSAEAGRAPEAGPDAERDPG